MPSWGTKVCLAFPVLYAMPRRSLCPALWLPTALVPRGTLDAHALTHLLVFLVHLHFPSSCLHPISPWPRPASSPLLYRSVVDLSAPWVSTGCTGESPPGSGASNALPEPPLQLLQSYPFGFFFYLSHD